MNAEARAGSGLTRPGVTVYQPLCRGQPGRRPGGDADPAGLGPFSMPGVSLKTSDRLESWNAEQLGQSTEKALITGVRRTSRSAGVASSLLPIERRRRLGSKVIAISSAVACGPAGQMIGEGRARGGPGIA